MKNSLKMTLTCIAIPRRSRIQCTSWVGVYFPVPDSCTPCLACDSSHVGRCRHRNASFVVCNPQLPKPSTSDFITLVIIPQNTTCNGFNFGWLLIISFEFYIKDGLEYGFVSILRTPIVLN